MTPDRKVRLGRCLSLVPKTYAAKKREKKKMAY